MLKKKTAWILFFLLAALAAGTAYAYGTFYIMWNVPLYGACLTALFLEGTALFWILLAVKHRKKKGFTVLKALLCGLVWIAAVFGVSFLVNVVLYKEQGADVSAACTAAMEFLLYVCGALILKLRTKQKLFPAPLLALLLSPAVLLCGILPPLPGLLSRYYSNSKRMEAIPTGLSVYTKKETALVTDADLYVAPDGSDDADGSFARPLATIGAARDRVRELDKTGRSGVTVAIKAGEYRINGLAFTAADSGTPECPVTYCAYGDGEVILNGGVTLDPAAFRPVSGEMAARLSPEAASHVVCLDLGALGVTAAEYGKIYTIGSYNTARQYDGDWVGPLYCELFVNDARCSLARYPDSGWLKTGEVVKMGFGRESDGSMTAVENWEDTRNPESDVYKVDDALAERINGWKTLDDVWMFGFWKYTWADASSPVGAFDYAARTLSPKFVSVYGAIKDAPYYFFNVFEELDSPGEWYLDRAAGVLYLYAPEDFANAAVDLSLSTETLLTAENVHDLTFTGFTLKGTRGDAVQITGDRNTVSRCLIKNIAGTALIMEGYDNLASENEITRTGKAGIVIKGGETETLTPGNSKADNNLIHDWSEIYQTYQPAVTLVGVGNVCSHNEIFNSPHEAITYEGCNHLVEYNLIHDVCLISDDAGAIYAGRHWDWYGNVIRFNAIYNLGTPGEHSPQGIYMDDALSGQTIYGNLLVNIPCFGLQLGGGRDLIVQNNIVINTKSDAVSFDQRAADGVLRGGWFNHCGEMYAQVLASPWQTEAWKAAFPEMQGLHLDPARSDDPMFAANAANCKVTGNLFVNERGSIGTIEENPARFSDVSGNAVYRMNAMKKLFADPANGDYRLREDAPVYKLIPDFQPLPLAEIGRY